MELLLLLLIILIIIIPLSVKIVRQGYIGLIETLGEYKKTVTPGLTFVIPGIQRLRRVDIREQVINVPEQEVITSDNVGVTVDGIVYVRIDEPVKSTYEINNVYMAVVNLAQTNLRSVLGTMNLDDTLSNRETINARLKSALDIETAKWWVNVTRVEIKRLDPPTDIQDAMSKQMKAEREKRASVLEAQGYKEAQILKAEWDKKSAILQAEWDKQSAILRAEWVAKEIELEASSAQQFFEGNAVTKEQLNVARSALENNTKYVVDSDLLADLSKVFTKK